jgi:hypothetical protein
MSDEHDPERTRMPTNGDADRDRLSWPEDDSPPGPDGSVTIKVRRWELPKHP